MQISPLVLGRDRQAIPISDPESSIFGPLSGMGEAS